jgi:hypothetical protein
MTFHLAPSWSLVSPKGAARRSLPSWRNPRKSLPSNAIQPELRHSTKYIESRSLQDTVKTYYAVDQADRPVLEHIIAAEFATMPLDLVIDDASHLLRETRASFNALFPRLRPGGVYVVEDWPWGHYDDDMIPPNAREHWNSMWPTGTPLTVLLFELVMTCDAENNIIDELAVEQSFVRVRRGSADLDPSTFDISESFNRGTGKSYSPTTCIDKRGSTLLIIRASAIWVSFTFTLI